MASDCNNGIIAVMDSINYSYWSHLMQNFLKGQKLWKYVASKIDSSKTTDTKYEYSETVVRKIN